MNENNAKIFLLGTNFELTNRVKTSLAGCEIGPVVTDRIVHTSSVRQSCGTWREKLKSVHSCRASDVFLHSDRLILSLTYLS